MSRVNRLRWWLGCGFLLSGAALAVFFFPNFSAEMRAALREPELGALDERLANVDPVRVGWLRSQSGGRWGNHGWLLAANEQGRVVLALPGNQEGLLRLRLWVNDPGNLMVRLVSGDQEYSLDVASLDGRILKFSVRGPSEIELVAVNRFASEFLVLDRIAAVWTRPADLLPNPWGIGAALYMVVFGYIMLQWEHMTGRWYVPVGIVGVLAAVCVGFVHRYELLDISRGLTNEPDVVAYKEHVHRLEWFTEERGFYSGSFREREPLHVGVLKIWTIVWGDTFPAIRWYTVTMSTLVVAGIGTFIWRVTGQWLWGGVAAWMTALSPAWVDESIKGLRLESMTVLLLAALSIWLWGRGWIGAITLGFVVGALALLQSPILSAVLALFWFTWCLNWLRARRGRPHVVASHWNWRHLILASVLSVLIFVPHLYGMYKIHGDLSWNTHGYARWNANGEFPERLGTAGFPTAEEVKKDSYAGPPITYSEYLFGLHSIRQLILGQLKGWAESTLYLSASVVPHLKQLLFLREASGTWTMLSQTNVVTAVSVLVLMVMTIVGWVSLWRHLEYWWVPFFTLLGTWYAAYLYSVRLVEPFRHTGHVYPLLLLCFVMGCQASFRWVMSNVESLKSRPMTSRS